MIKKTMKTLALFVALAFAQTTVIPAVYAEDGFSKMQKIHKENINKEKERKEREKQKEKERREREKRKEKERREKQKHATVKPMPVPGPVTTTPTPTPVPTPAPAPAPTTGKAVYDAKCASCHVLTGTTTKNLAGKGARVATSHKAGILSATEVSLLAAYLNSQIAPVVFPAPVTATPAPVTIKPVTTTPAPVTVTPAPTPAPVTTTPVPVTTAPAIDGAALYTQKCAGCHGLGKRGKSVAATQSAISGNVGGMGFLSSLSAAQLTAISQY